MSEPTRLLLLEAAVRLRGVDSDSWDRFLQALNTHAVSATAGMMRATPDVLLKAQGYAIGLNELAELLIDAPNQLDKARNRNNARRQQ